MSWDEDTAGEMAAAIPEMDVAMPIGEDEQLIEMPEIKLFNKWSLNDVEVSDISLVVSEKQSVDFQRRAKNFFINCRITLPLRRNRQNTCRTRPAAIK